MTFSLILLLTLALTTGLALTRLAVLLRSDDPRRIAGHRPPTSHVPDLFEPIRR